MVWIGHFAISGLCSQWKLSGSREWIPVHVHDKSFVKASSRNSLLPYLLADLLACLLAYLYTHMYVFTHIQFLLYLYIDIYIDERYRTDMRVSLRRNTLVLNSLEAFRL